MKQEECSTPSGAAKHLRAPLVEGGGARPSPSLAGGLGPDALCQRRQRRPSPAAETRSGFLPPVSQDVHASMALPDPLRGTGRLFLWPDGADVARSLEAVAVGLCRPLDRYDDSGCVALHIEEGHALPVLDALRKRLDSSSLAGTQAVFKLGLDEPSLADFPRADSLLSFIAFARAKWIGDMIFSRRLTAWFQPIVDVHEPGRIVAWEALARGYQRGEEAEMVLPGRLISAARDAGLMAIFDRFIHEQALLTFGRPGISGAGLFLNVTPRALEDPRFDLGHLHQHALESGIAPERITLEIIESETIFDMSRMQDVLTEARGLGFGIALDDLGAGFSNLNLIHQLRPDVVKLDMDLIRNIQSDGYKAVLAEKILEATCRLGLKTVAEGVECEEELEWLRAHGVDYVQGFLIARPGPTPALMPPRSLSA